MCVCMYIYIDIGLFCEAMNVNYSVQCFMSNFDKAIDRCYMCVYI